MSTTADPRGRSRAGSGPGARLVMAAALAWAVLVAPPADGAAGDGDRLGESVDRYIEPYVATGSFSGSILIARRGEVLFRGAYGFANLEHQVPNTPRTVYHLASVSRIFTCAAILVLEQRGKLRVDDPVGRHLAGYPRGDAITLHHLLTGASGIPNVNDLEGYDLWSTQPQTPSTLVEKFRDLPLEFEPGERSVHSNSNYALLALVIETVSGKSYGDFLRDELFAPLGMERTGHDGDPSALIPDRASGYAPVGRAALVNAPTLDWSVKTGNGSLYSTVEDLYRWDRALVSGALLSPAAVEKTFTDHVEHNGYGWFVRERFGTREVHINGRSPGFGSYWGRSLGHDVTVIVLGNIYNSQPTTIGRDLIAMALDEPFEPPRISAAKVGSEALREVVGSYRFGPDYYSPNREVTLRDEDGDLFIDWGWLMPAGEGRFLDRLYGGEVEFRRDADGRVVEMLYDGFVGKRVGAIQATP